MDNRYRRRCRSCGKRISLKITKTQEGLFIICPHCCAKTRFISQKNWENKKNS